MTHTSASELKNGIGNKIQTGRIGAGSMLESHRRQNWRILALCDDLVLKPESHGNADAAQKGWSAAPDLLRE